MLGFLFNLIFSRVRSQFKGFKLQVIYLLQDLLSIFILFHTSQAFSETKTTEHSLFGYLLIGELILRLPTSLLFTPFERMRPWIESGALEYALSFKGGLKKVIFFESFSYALIDLVRCLFTLSCCAVIFDEFIGRELFFRALIIEIVTMPLFLLIGLTLLPVSIFFSWGRMLIGRGIGLLAIFSGGYFPLQLLGQYQALLEWINPLSIYVKAIKVGFYLSDALTLVAFYLIISMLFTLTSSQMIKRIKSGKYEELKG